MMEWKKLATAGKKIDAIKSFRKHNPSLTLKEAKLFIEGFIEGALHGAHMVIEY